MENMSYNDTPIAITHLIGMCGFAKTVQQTVVLALLCHLPTTKHVAMTKQMTQITTLPPTFDVYISLLARISEVAEKSAKEEAEWQVQKNSQWILNGHIPRLRLEGGPSQGGGETKRDILATQAPT